MSNRFPGGVVRKNQLIPAANGASGVWTIGQATQATKSDIWPYSNIGMPISQSLRFRASASAYLQRTPGSAATSSQKWTWSGWVKRSKSGSQTVLFEAGTDANPDLAVIYWGSYADSITMQMSGTYIVVGSGVMRDPSAWYHIVMSADTTQATAANRFHIYVNGSEISYQVDNRSTTTTQNSSFAYLNKSSNTQSIGRSYYYGYYWDGYMTEINMIDGQQLDSSYFGQTNAITGVWEIGRAHV